jgi:hypothetical protein
VCSLINLINTPSRGSDVFIAIALSLGIDITLTSMITIRFFTHRNQARQLGPKFIKPYTSLMLIFVESGVLTTSAKIGAVISPNSGFFVVPLCVSFFAQGLTGDDLADWRFVQSIAPSLIIIRIALGIDFKDYCPDKYSPQKKVDDAIFESELGNVVGGPGLHSVNENKSPDVVFPSSDDSNVLDTLCSSHSNSMTQPLK